MKKILPLLVLFLSFLSLQAQTGYWSDYAASGFSSGTGTKTDPYQIKTAEELAFLSNQVNSGVSYVRQYFEMTDNIDLSAHFWVPIGKKNNVGFNGSFDGKGKNIDAIKIPLDNVSKNYFHIGLFGNVYNSTSDSLIIKNIILTNVDISDSVRTSGSTGGLIGSIGGNTKIENCNVKGTINCYGVNYDAISSVLGVGGIIGLVNLFSGGVIVTNCVNNISIQHTTNDIGGAWGGIIGYAFHNVNLVVTDCVNNGNITKGDRNIIGGIIGHFYDENNSATILRCVNNGTLDGENGTIGGIIGSLEAGRNTQIEISSCSNVGNISDNMAGGIIGGAQQLINNPSILKINDSHNSGEIKGKFVGGILASYDIGGSTIDTSIGLLECSKCYNNGKILGTTAGGIIGIYNSTKEKYATSRIINSFNNGVISGSSYCGGIIGKADVEGTLTVNSTYNAGNIESGSTGYAGGISGFLTTKTNLSNVKLTQSFSKALITTPQYGGGLVGGIKMGQESSICQIDSCLSLINEIQTGSENHRIVGHLEGFSTEANSFGTLGNYAWQKNWAGTPGLKTVEGGDWDGLTSLLGDEWVIDNTDNLPKLKAISLEVQPNVKNPLKIFSSIASDMSTSSVQGGKGFILVKDANSGARIEVFGLSGMRVISKQIEAPNTTIPIERGIYIVRIGRETCKVIVQ